MEIHKQINEIVNYFENKIINGDFEFNECSEHTAKITIDNQYQFELWIANDPKDNFRFYGYWHSLSFFDKAFKTQKKRIKAYSKLKPFIICYKNNILKQKKEKELEDLKQQLKRLNNEQ